jgi:hypothetical protein
MQFSAILLYKTYRCQLILGYGSPTHSHMPLSEITPDSDLLSCLRCYSIAAMGRIISHRFSSLLARFLSLPGTLIYLTIGLLLSLLLAGLTEDIYSREHLCRVLRCRASPIQLRHCVIKARCAAAYTNTTCTRHCCLRGANTAQRLWDRSAVNSDLKLHAKLLRVSSKLIRCAGQAVE